MNTDAPNNKQHRPRARQPSQIPLRGWWAIVTRVAREFGRHRTTITAAGVSFLALFSVFSGIAAFVAFFGLFSDPQSVVSTMQSLHGFVPADIVVTLIGQMNSVTTRSTTSLLSAGIFSLVIALWCAQAAVAALMIALNTAYREPAPAHAVRHFAKSLGLAIAVILGLILIAVLSVGLPLAALRVDERFWVLEFTRAAGMGLAGLLLFFGLAALYRWVPERRPPRWRWVVPGAALVVGFWVIGSIVFSVFLAYANSYAAMYGSLSAVVILLTLTYVTVTTVLVGAEFNAQMEYQSPRAGGNTRNSLGPVHTNADRRVVTQNTARQGARREVW